jgi:hypothetical protein
VILLRQKKSKTPISAGIIRQKWLKQAYNARVCDRHSSRKKVAAIHVAIDIF